MILVLLASALALAFLFILLGTVGLNALSTRRASGTKERAVTPKKIKLSWAAKQILDKYNGLPAENRTFGDITAVLVALDIKHGGRSEVDDHFIDSYYTGIHRSIEPRIIHQFMGTEYRTCARCKDYNGFIKNIDEIVKANEERSRQFELDNVAGDIDRIKELTESLRNEAKLVRDITKELL